VTYAYDELNRLRSVTTTSLAAAPPCITTTLVAAHRLRLPNTTSTAYAYDALNRVQSMKIGSALGTANETVRGFVRVHLPRDWESPRGRELSGRKRDMDLRHLWRLTNETIARLGWSQTARSRTLTTASATGSPHQFSERDPEPDQQVRTEVVGADLTWPTPSLSMFLRSNLRGLRRGQTATYGVH